MLKLQRIQIQGFKSFADKTELLFQGEGITVIVGPNGCGKSNISDAVAWVLGEQSPKTLRGGRMEDVIFNGTRSRLPLGLAEVSLTFVDPEVQRESGPPVKGPALEPRHENETQEKRETETLLEEIDSSSLTEPGEIAEAVAAVDARTATAVKRKRRPKMQVAPGELVVSRRLFRSGESEYLINGRMVRLRDIQDIFMGTGLGPDSYAIIEQGRIGLILSSKPSDRRSIIEEAAGITKFKSKRKLAESKLEQAKQNLLRINDIAEEVGKQLGSLKRQASKARRYGELRDKAREVSKRLFVSRELDLERLLENNDQLLKTTSRQYQEKHQSILDQEHVYRQGNASIFALEEELKLVREQLSQTTLEIERAQQKVQYHREHSRELESRSRENNQEIEGLQQQEAFFVKEVEQKQAFLREATDEFERLQSEFLAQNSTSQELQTRIHDLESSEDQYRSQLLDCVELAATLRNQLLQMDELDARLEQQIIRLNAEKEEASTLRESLVQELSLARRQQQEEEAALRELNHLAEVLGEKLADFKEQESIKTQQLAENKEKQSSSTHRLRSLQDLAAHHAYNTDAVRLLLSTAAESASNGFQTKGILADLIEVESPHEAAVEEFLKQELEFFLVESPTAAAEGISLLRRKGAGKSTFLLCHDGSESATSFLDHEVEGVMALEPAAVPLQNLVQFPESVRLAAREALPNLYAAFLVPSYQRACELARLFPQLIFLTSEGETVRGRLISGGGKTAGGHLSLKKEIRELNRKVDSLHKVIAVEEEETLVLRQFILSQEAEAHENRQKSQELEKMLVGSGLRVKQYESELDRVIRRDNLAQAESQRIEEERTQIRARRAESEDEILAADAAKSRIEGLISDQQAQLRQLKEQASQDSQALSELRSGLAAFRERKQAVEADLNRLASSLKECGERIQRLDVQRSSWSQQIQEIEESIRGTEELLFNQAVQKASLEANIRARENQLLEAREVQSQLEIDLQSLRTELEEVQNQKTQWEIERARLNSDAAHLEEICIKELGMHLQEIRPESPVPLTGEELYQLEAEYQELKNRIEGMGPVNMMALEEYQECEQRFQFLSTQRQDLLDSIEDTTAAIKEIDQVSREQFREAFEAINDNFQESFRTLFGGGHGEMKLLDEQDELDSGIEIIAQPPGKRLQNVLLLSGGEKALTAIALLLAIFRYQPSPFCVLDEVDAPLDEINVGRFCQMIQLMSTGTQFLVISHSKRTMEAADTLYGVTMQEAGVSKLVSVQFE